MSFTLILLSFALILFGCWKRIYRFKREFWAAQFSWREALSTAFGKVQWASLGFSCTAGWLHWRGFAFHVFVWGMVALSFRAPQVHGVGYSATSSVKILGVFELRLENMLCILPQISLPSSVATPGAMFVILCMTGWSWVREISTAGESKGWLLVGTLIFEWQWFSSFAFFN